jgi:hypothetical protein
MCTAHNRFRPLAICFVTLKAHYYRHHEPPLELVSITLLVLSAAKIMVIYLSLSDFLFESFKFCTVLLLRFFFPRCVHGFLETLTFENKGTSCLQNIGKHKLNNTGSKARRPTCFKYCYIVPVPSTLTVCFKYLLLSANFS